ncbi:MAG: amino acid ABC transporter substrate-binding protein [Desulfarculaceae bacterium]|nr:amino acid ABC transporter substrate-binding protein [Desulfarculaceae bacterium]
MILRRAGIVLIALSLVLGLGAQTTCLAARAFVIGCTVPLTGQFGKVGQLLKESYGLWAEKVNDNGGIAGQNPVRLVFRDDQSSPKVSAMLVERLITQDKVDLLLGSYGSAQVMAAAAVAERHKVPYLSGGASADRLYQRHYKYFFGTLGKATEAVRGAVEVFTTVSPKPKTVAILGSNLPFAKLACQGFKKYAEKSGFKIIHYELFPVQLKDYDTILLKAKAKRPDLLLVGSRLEVAVRMVEAMQAIDFNPKAVAFSDGPLSPAFRQGLRAKADYVFTAGEWAPNLPFVGSVFGSAREFNDTFQKRLGRAPGSVEAASVAAAVAQQKAVEALGLRPGFGPAARIRLAEKLHRMELTTFYGPVRFDADGAIQKRPPVAMQVQKGRIVNVYPEDWAEKKPLYPMPAWKDR